MATQVDISLYLQRFESSLSSYEGDDPLELWQKFVDHLELKLPPDDRHGMSLVFDTLVQRFLEVTRYADDVRYVNYCIKCAGFYSDPIPLYTHLFSRGVGTRSAALYVAWAQQFERRGMSEQAEDIYRKARENQAQPADMLLHEHREFQTRSRGLKAPATVDRAPLQNSGLTNQLGAQNKPSLDGPSKPRSTTVTVSRSETSAMLRSRPQSSDVQFVSAYAKDELVCEGSEFCFEEVRAAKYFRKLEEKRRKMGEEIEKKIFPKSESLFCNFSHVLVDSANQKSSQMPSPVIPNDRLSERPPVADRLSVRRSIGLTLRSEDAISDPRPYEQSVPGASCSLAPPAEWSIHSPADAFDDGEDGVIQRPEKSVCVPAEKRADLCQDDQVSGAISCPEGNHNEANPFVSRQSEPEENLDSSHAVASVSHVTPNTSLGYVQATPSRVVLPSPTVNTREALGVIMDMFKAPTFLEEMFDQSSALHAANTEEPHGNVSVAAAAAAKPPASTPFTIFQDDNQKENAGAVAPPTAEKSKTVRALSDITTSKIDKTNDTPPELAPDESTMWGVGYNPLTSLAACPNSSTDFAMLARCVSTPFTNKTFSNGTIYQDQENVCDGGKTEDGAFARRQTNKLSPIIEQSPSEDKHSESAASCLAPSYAQHGTIVGEQLMPASLAAASSSVSAVQPPPPPAALSFRDQTAGPGWEIYSSPERTVTADTTARSCQASEETARPTSPVQDGALDVPMSPECPIKPDWMEIGSPAPAVLSHLDAFVSPRRPATNCSDWPLSCADVPMSPQQGGATEDDAAMTSPDGWRGEMKTPQRLVSDPWDAELISRLLSSLSPPLSSHPHCVTWQGAVPDIRPNMTITMGRASLRVDGVVGRGAFATVYQVTDPMTSERMVLKVQKPSNPWEFYVNTQLDARMTPDTRRLFSRFSSAHLFQDGSVLLGELHNYGTLLNAVNLYKCRSDKVMPQPLVMFFTVCILNTVERLHGAGIVHADIKPDNFLLGERFLESRGFEADSSDHGLVLVDLGQSIDMRLFPPGSAFTAKCLTSGFQCTEMLSGTPWNYQTDYFGIAATVHCLLFGTYMQVTEEDGVWKSNGAFRRNPHSDLWGDFFHTLLNVPGCDSPPDLRRLRDRAASTLRRCYDGKLASLKSRLVVMLLENRKAARR